MFGLLELIANTVAAIGQLVLWACISALNLIVAAVSAALTALLALLPEMSSAGEIGSPTWLKWLNWFFPIGTFLTMLAAAIVLWTSFLILRFALKWLRAL